MEMLTVHLNRSHDIPLYEQLYRHIKQEIIKGKIAYRTKLPSKRKLAEHLKVSQNTVEYAYEQLVAEGFLEAVPRKGFFVMAKEELEYIQPEPDVQNPPQNDHDNVKYHFHPSWIDTDNFPMDLWRRIARNIMTKENQNLLLLGESQGEYELRREIAEYLYHARGVNCTPENIVIGAGSEFLLQQIIHLFGEKTVYGVEDPGYHVISRLLHKHANQVYPLEVDGEGVKVSSFGELAIDVVYVTPSHHFPFGSVLPVNRRVKLLNWAQSVPGRYIIEDDYDSEFRYSGKTIPSLQSMDKSGKVIYLGSFSKSLIPSLRISYMVLPNELLERYKEELSFYHCSVSRLDQHILSSFMREGHFEKHLNRMRKIYRRKLELVLEILNKYPEYVEVIGEHSGLHIVLTVKNGMKESELIKRAMAEKLKVYPVSYYFLEKKEEFPPKIILGFAGIPENELENAIMTLLTSWEIGNGRDKINSHNR